MIKFIIEAKDLGHHFTFEEKVLAKNLKSAINKAKKIFKKIDPSWGFLYVRNSQDHYDRWRGSYDFHMNSKGFKD